MGANDQPPQITIPTGNPWPALKQHADKNYGAEDALKFDSHVAYQLADAVSRVIGGVQALKDVIKDVSGEKPLAPPDLFPSGDGLGKKFGAKGHEFDGILDKHIRILRDMMDTIVAAGKAYAHAEHENEAMFDSIKVAKGHLSIPIPMATDIPRKKSHHPRTPGALQNSQGFEPSTIWPEAGDFQSWENLYGLGQYIEMHSTAQRMANWSGKWKAMARNLDSIYGAFSTEVDSITTDQWTGPGSRVAVAAMKGYASSIPGLKQRMLLVAAALEDTAGWLEATRISMPQQEHNPAGQTHVVRRYRQLGPKVDIPETRTYTQPDQLPQYRQAYKDTYHTGITLTHTRVPTLPPAEGAFSQMPVNPIAGAPSMGYRDTPGGAGSSTGGVSPFAGGVGTPGGGGASPMHTPSIATAGMPKYGSSPATTGAGRQREAQLTAAYQGEAAARERERVAQRNGAREQQATEAAARQAQEQSALQQAASGAGQGVEQAMAGLQQAAQTAAGLQQAAQRDSLAKSISALPGLELPTVPADLAKSLSGGGGGGGPLASPLNRDVAQASSKLFPRAPLGSAPNAETAGVAVGRAGLAPTMGTPGSPGTPVGAPNGASSQQGKEHKRAAYLESVKHLDEALGEAPRVVKQVVE
ncbi:hypothetical protein ABTW96_24300 [Nocardia beijingensis]|uniref:hypothetical protein n=1 Tax=Nocardia beijingensis TaxID=95162 RepID=UPI003328994C